MVDDAGPGYGPASTEARDPTLWLGRVTSAVGARWSLRARSCRVRPTGHSVLIPEADRPVPVNGIAAEIARVGALGRVDLHGIGFDLD